MTDYEKQVDKLVDELGCSIKEAEQIIADDKKINRGEKVDFGLSAEDEKKALKYANVTTHKRKTPMIPNFKKNVERKPDITKEGVIQALADFLNDKGYANVEIINKSKLIEFKIGADTYKIDLIRKRPPKK